MSSAFFATLGVSSPARAAQTRVCVDFDFGAHMVDSSRRPLGSGEGPSGAPVNDYLEDFGRITILGSMPAGIPIDYPFPASRWLVRVVNEDTGMPVWGFSPLDADGCTSADVEYDAVAQETLRIEYVRWTEFADGRSLLGYDCVDKSPQELCTFGLPGDDPQSASGTEVLNAIIPVENGDTRVTVGAYFDPPAAESLPTILSPSEYVLWSIDFAEASLRLWDSLAYQVYVGHEYDSEGTLPNSLSNATRIFGGHPSIGMLGTNYRSKFLAAHEYGHIQTGILAGIPNDGTAADYAYEEAEPLSHGPNSIEYQSAACIEGFADAYAAWVWNDPSSLPAYKALTSIQERLAIPSGDAAECGASMICEGGNIDGVANEHDWASALVQLESNHAGLTPQNVSRLLKAAYDGASVWDLNTLDDTFWDEFQGVISGELRATEYADWQSLAATWTIDD